MKPKNELSQGLSEEVRDLLDQTIRTTPESHECFPRRTAEEEEQALAQIAASQQNEREEEGTILKALRLLVEELKQTAQSPTTEPEYSTRVAYAVQSLATAMSDSDGYNKLEVLEEIGGEELALSLTTLRSAVAQALNVLCAADVRCSICGNPLDNTNPTDNLCNFCLQAGLELGARAAADRDPDVDDHSDAPRGMN